ncbi:hypothetical protein D210916BOD24_11580 [Alteromonas sp. D210916BOD_24]|uniref:hypothetical protein n=1 Tax=Alteromonas sp. D210916BOD_24 TaxID=3157618 RepID=UPI00399D2B7B
MNVLRWIYSGLAVSLVIVIIGVASNGSTFVSQASADDKSRPHDPTILEIERRYSLVRFDLSRKSHLLRKARLEYFIAEAKQADLRGWAFKRDKLVERAKSVMSHHLNQYAIEVSREAEAYTISAI